MEDPTQMETILLLFGKSRVTSTTETKATCLPRRFLPSEELIVTILAIFKAGMAYVPLAPNWPEGRVRHVIEDASPVMIITNQGNDYQINHTFYIDCLKILYRSS